MPTDHDDASSERAGRVRASAGTLFDLRTVLAGLFTVYGVVLLIMGLVSTSPEDAAKTGGIAINLWSGAAMLVTAVAFGAWALLRPLRAEPAEEQRDRR